MATKQADFEEGSQEREEAAAAAVEALRAGARAGSATVFVSAGGSSWALEAAWAGDALSRLDAPRARAELACAVEEALPGWQWSVGRVPDPGESFPHWSFSLRPIGEGGSDSARVREGVNGRGAEPAPLRRAMGILDQALGSASARFRQEACGRGLEDLFRTSDPRRALEAWRALRELDKPLGPGPGIGLAGLSSALRALALAASLDAQCPAAPKAAGCGPRV